MCELDEELDDCNCKDQTNSCVDISAKLNELFDVETIKERFSTKGVIIGRSKKNIRTHFFGFYHFKTDFPIEIQKQWSDHSVEQNFDVILEQAPFDYVNKAYPIIKLSEDFLVDDNRLLFAIAHELVHARQLLETINISLRSLAKPSNFFNYFPLYFRFLKFGALFRKFNKNYQVLTMMFLLSFLMWPLLISTFFDLFQQNRSELFILFFFIVLSFLSIISMMYFAFFGFFYEFLEIRTDSKALEFLRETKPEVDLSFFKRDHDYYFDIIVYSIGLIIAPFLVYMNLRDIIDGFIELFLQ